jgi:hypothetical protein
MSLSRRTGSSYRDEMVSRGLVGSVVRAYVLAERVRKRKIQELF